MVERVALLSIMVCIVVRTLGSHRDSGTSTGSASDRVHGPP